MKPVSHGEGVVNALLDINNTFQISGIFEASKFNSIVLVLTTCSWLWEKETSSLNDHHWRQVSLAENIEARAINTQKP